MAVAKKGGGGAKRRMARSAKLKARAGKVDDKIRKVTKRSGTKAAAAGRPSKEELLARLGNRKKKIAEKRTKTSAGLEKAAKRAESRGSVGRRKGGISKAAGARRAARRRAAK